MLQGRVSSLRFQNPVVTSIIIWQGFDLYLATVRCAGCPKTVLWGRQFFSSLRALASFIPTVSERFRFWTLPICQTMIEKLPNKDRKSRQIKDRSHRRATLCPVRLKSTSMPRHSRVNSSMTLSVRNRRPVLRLSLTKSIDQR